MKTAITFGVFDLTHLGHFMLFKRMKERFGRVCVFVQDSKTVSVTKKGAVPILSTYEKISTIKSCKYVDMVKSYKWLGPKHLSRVYFDVLVVGPEHHLDRRFQLMFDWCKRHGKEVVVLSRTKAISTTDIKNRITKSTTKKHK